MSATNMAKGALLIQYQIASLPLRLAERRTRALGADSPVHLFAERVADILDDYAEKFLDDGELRRRVERENRYIDALSLANRPEQDTAGRGAQARLAPHDPRVPAGDRPGLPSGALPPVHVEGGGDRDR